MSVSLPTVRVNRPARSATVENRLGPDPPDRAEFVLGFGPTAGQSKKAAMGYS